MNNSNVQKKLNRSAGFSIVELMIALAIGLLVVGVIAFMFLQTKQSSRQNEATARLQENARYAISSIADELQHAGFLGKMSYLVTPNSDASLVAPATDCGDVDPEYDAYALDTPILYTSGTTNSDNSCVSNADVFDGVDGAGTDILTIKSVVPTPVAVASLTANNTYLRTSLRTGSTAHNCLWTNTAGTPDNTTTICPNNDDTTATADTDDWELRASVFYIKDPGTGIPNLCRKTYRQGAAPDMVEECLVEGIERFVVEFGIDTVGNDGLADSFSAVLPADLSTVVTARIYFLVRTIGRDSNHIDRKTYNLGAINVDPVDDNFYRKVFSTTVVLRNLINKNNF